MSKLGQIAFILSQRNQNCKCQRISVPREKGKISFLLFKNRKKCAKKLRRIEIEALIAIQQARHLQQGALLLVIKVSMSQISK